MPSHRTRRNGWTRNKKDGWTRSLGERGMRVTLFQNRRNGTFYRKVWRPVDSRYDVESLRTSDRDEAERLGRTLLAELLTDNSRRAAAAPSLIEVWTRFKTESQSYRDCAPSTRKDYEAGINRLMGFFGEGCDVTTITPNDVAAYVAKRLVGGIISRTGHVTRPVRARAADGDIAVLNIIMRWATAVRAAELRNTRPA